MSSAKTARRVPWLRYALLAAVLSALWLVVSLFSSAPSASADEGETGNGVLGAVGSLLGGATGLTGAVGETLEGVVGSVVAPVDDVVAPVVDVLPEPVEEPVSDLVPAAVQTVTGTADALVDGGNTAVGTVVNGAVDSVSGIAGGAPLSGVMTPVAGPADGIVQQLPVVADLLPAGALGDVLGPITGIVDDTLGAVAGSTPPLPTDGSGVLPRIPRIPLLTSDRDGARPVQPVQPGLPEPGGAQPGPASQAPPGSLVDEDRVLAMSHGSIVAQQSVTGLQGTVTPIDATEPGLASPGLGAPIGGAAGSGTGASGSGSGSGAASGTSDAIFASLELDALASLALHSVDDELPSSPVYSTDSTPD